MIILSTSLTALILSGPADVDHLATPAPTGAAVDARALPDSIEFVANAGQWPEDIAFVAEAPTLRARVGSGGLGFDVHAGTGDDARAAFLQLEFVGGSWDGPIETEGRSATMRHFYLGSDPGRWATGVPAFERLRCVDVYPGIDVVLEERGGTVAYALHVEPWADLSAVELRLHGADRTTSLADGRLESRLEFGALTQTAPVSWYELPAGGREPVDSGFAFRTSGRFGFEISDETRAMPLVIDPGLTWSSFIGGSSEEWLTDVITDDEDRIIVAGYTRSVDFPSLPGPFPFVGARDGFISRLDLSGAPTADFVAFIGGSAFETLAAIAQGPMGRLYVTGWTDSSDFPVSPTAFDTSYGGDHMDGFVACLREDADALIYGTYVGGDDSEDELKAIAVDAQGQATVVGRTISDDYPVTPGAYQTPPVKVSWQGTVTRLSADGSALVFSTLLGGLTSIEDFRAVVVDSEGNTFVAGDHAGGDYPKTPGTIDTGNAGASLSKLDPTGSILLASTVIGGSDSGLATDFNAIGLGPDGNVFLTGTTRATDYPSTPGAFDEVAASGNGYEFMVTCVDSSLTSILRSTFLGGVASSFGSAVHSIDIDDAGVVTVAGTTNSATGIATTAGSAFPDPGMFSRGAFVSRLDPTFEKLLYGSFFAGPNQTSGFAIFAEAEGVALLSDGSAVTVGRTSSSDFPVTPDAIQPHSNGFWEGFVTVLDMLPDGAERFGTSTEACKGPIWIGVTEMPQAGSATFGLTASGAPPTATGFLVLSATSLPAGLPVLGVDAFVDPLAVALTQPVTSDSAGWADASFPLPPTSSGVTGYFQFLWVNTPGCAGTSPFSASTALEVSVP